MNNKNASYMDIVKHYEECFMQYGDCCKGVDWPNEIDALKRYKVMMEIIEFDKSHVVTGERVSVLDFGCGLGHLYDYISENSYDFDYTGADISELFVKSCRKKYPQGKFICIDILNGEGGSEKQYDYILVNGVFTEKRELTFEEMFQYVKKMISRLYSMCKYGVAFNVMSKNVDWERDDLFHLSLNELSSFLTENITRDYIIRNDYGLYEYTVYVYKRLE